MDVWIIAGLAWSVWIAMFVWAWRKASRVPWDGAGVKRPGPRTVPGTPTSVAGQFGKGCGGLGRRR